MDIKATYTPLSEINDRIRRLQQALAAAGMDAALLMQSADLFYYSGTVQQAYLHVPAEGEPVLMVRKDADRARAESPLARIVEIDRLQEIPGIIRTVPGVLGLELDVISAEMYLKLVELFPGIKCVDVSGLVRLQRAVKSAYEVEKIRQAAALADQLDAFVPEALKPGISELEFSGRVEAEARRLGHQGLIRMRLWGADMFYGHIMAGDSAGVVSSLSSPTGGPGMSPAFPQGGSLKPIRPGEPVLVDIAFAYMGYLADHTRIFALGGLPDELLRAHQAMLDVQKTVMAAAVPGTPAGKLYDLALGRATELGYEKNFMGVGKKRIRFVGHGVGTEMDEFPFLAKGQTLALAENMIIALEPKLIFPGKGVVGIENTHLVTKAGLVSLTTAPEEIIIV
ncbi:MAG: Xaa-Pro peptidase family protein [Thermodesulfobacteriota bacterium]